MADWGPPDERTWGLLFGWVDFPHTWGEFGSHVVVYSPYAGQEDEATYGQLFGDSPGTYGDFGDLLSPPVVAPINPPTPATVPAGGITLPPPPKVWITASRPAALTASGVAHYRIVVPLTSRRIAKQPATPLPAPSARWNDEQDLADILRLLGMAQ